MSSPMPLGARVIALTALLWNLFGLLVFVLRVAVTPEQAALLPPEQQMLDAALPTWVNGVFGLAVIAGIAGSIALLIARRWAPPMLRVSLLAAVVQTLASYALAPVWAVSGMAGAEPMVYSTKSISSTAAGTYTALLWTASDFGGTTDIPYGEAPSVTCTLPPQTAITQVINAFDYDIGS